MTRMRPVSLGAVVILSLLPAVARAQRGGSSGWVGVAYTTNGQTDRRGTLIFSDYPVIESIEPSSPAERAGLAAGDTILAMNSQDLRRSPLPTATMIQPGRKIVFRFKRNDTVREVTLTVAPRPRGTSERFSVTLMEQSAVAAAAAAAAGAAPTIGVSPQQVLQRDVRARAEARARTPAPPGTALVPLMLFPFGPRTFALAGAELTSLNEDLASMVGISSHGIFVVNVALGTPAKESGLRPGDVILKADASPVGDPGELIRVMRETTGNSVRLEIVRKKKPQTITLRW